MKSLMKTLRLNIIVVDVKPLQNTCMHHKYISRINAIAAKQCLWPNCIKKDF